MRRIHVPDPVERARLLARVRELARVTHANLVPIPRVELEGDVAVVVHTEPSAGERLDDLGALPSARVAAIGADVLAGLGALHRAGFVHRGITAAAITVSRAHARLDLPDLDALVTSIAREHLLGSAHAGLAPELVRGHEVSPATDCYMLAAALFGAVADRPLHGGSGLEILVAIVRDPPALAVLDVLDHPRLADMLRMALAPVPEARPRDALAMLAMLGEVDEVDDPVERGLLAAIADDPRDVHAHQVYGDWLEQRGPAG